MCMLIQYLGLWVLFFFKLLSWMFEHDCSNTCCFGCLMCMCFVFLYLHLFSTVFTRKGALENVLINIISIIIIIIIIILSQ